MKTNPYPLRMNIQLQNRIEKIAVRKSISRADCIRMLLSERLDELEENESAQDNVGRKPDCPGTNDIEEHPQTTEVFINDNNHSPT